MPRWEILSDRSPSFTIGTLHKISYRRSVAGIHLKIGGFFTVSLISSQAVVLWTGATSVDPFDDSNWDFTGSSVTSVNSNVSVDDDISVVGGSVEIPNLPGQIRLQIGNGFSMTLDNSVMGLVAGGNDGVGGALGGTGVNVNLVNGSEFNVFFIVNSVSLDIDSTSSATFGGGGVPINISTVEMTEGAILSFLAETPTAFRTEHLSKITVDGVAAEEGVNIQIDPFNGNLGSQITVLPIPEPSASLLIALDGVAFLVRRRK